MFFLALLLFILHSNSYTLVFKGGFPLQGRVGGRTPLPVDLSYLSFVGCFDTPLLDAWPRGPGLADLDGGFGRGGEDMRIFGCQF